MDTCTYAHITCVHVCIPKPWDGATAVSH